MSNQVEYIFEQPELPSSLVMAEMTGDELTEIAVEALCRAFQLLREDFATETLH